MDLSQLKNVDIYLIDQLLKGRIAKHHRILDVGFGSGRNFRFFASQNYNIHGIEPIDHHVEALTSEFPNYAESIEISSIESWESDHRFDFIICSAVLHFAKNHTHFEELFDALVKRLDSNGILFIRMTTDAGIESELSHSTTGTYALPDGTQRYLIKRKTIDDLLKKHNLQLLDPFKTSLVERLRSMATIVVQKRASDS